MNAGATRFARFCAVGVTNTLLTLLAYRLLTDAGVAPGISSAAGFTLGATNGYLLNRAWTFRVPGGPATLARYVAVQALGALTSGAGVTLLSSELSLGELLAECLVVPLVTALTYTLSRRFVFRIAARPLRVSAPDTPAAVLRHPTRQGGPACTFPRLGRSRAHPRF